MTSPLPIRLSRATLTNSSWYLDQLITFLAIGEDTGWRFALLRVHGCQGTEPRAHYHTSEDETIYLLTGEMTVRAGGDALRITPGDTVTIPRGLEHRLSYDTTEVTFLAQFSPAGFERYFHEMSEPAEYVGRPPSPVAPDLARMALVGARYGCIFSAPGTDATETD